MLNKTKKRLDYVDWAKAISITLIVMGHMLPSGCWPKTLAYAFHVPAFAFVGGLLFSAPKSFWGVGKKLLNILKRMVIPYLIWFSITVSFYWKAAEEMPNIVKGTATTEFLQLLKYFVFYEKVTAWNDPLWFMPCYIIISVFFLLFVTLTKGNRYASGALSALSFTILIVHEKLEVSINAGEIKNVFGINNYFLLLGFLAAGYAIKPLLDLCANAFSSPKRNPIMYSSIAVFLVTACLCLGHNKLEVPNSNLTEYYTLSMYSCLYNGFLEYILFALVLIVSLLLALMLLPRCKVAELLSRNSLFLMFTHYFFFLDITFSWLKGAEWAEFMVKNEMLYWELDFSIGIRDGIFIMVCYVIFLYLVDALLQKLPKLKPAMGLFGLQ